MRGWGAGLREVVSRRARLDVLEIAAWYGRDGDAAVAVRFLGRVAQTLRQLTGMPRLGRVLQMARIARGMRAWPVRGFDKDLIVYQVDAATLIVLRVVHGMRDLPAVFAPSGGRRLVCCVLEFAT